MAQPTVDPWLLDATGQPDPFAGTVDFSLRPEDAIDPDGDPVIQPTLEPEVITTPPVEVATAPATEPQEPESEVIDIGDGAQVILEREKGQWKATLDPGNGANPEVFWGKNKNELLTNTLKGKLNATRKIRELNAKVKFQGAPSRPQAPAAPEPSFRELTADETVEIKLQLEANPNLAFQTWFQKSTGMSLKELVDMASEGRKASVNLQMEGATKEFLARTPEYFPDAGYKNFTNIVKWLAKFKLGKTATDANVADISYELGATGNWTVENLEEAFTDLTNDGLMIKAPKTPKQNLPQAEPTPPVVVQNVEPAQPAPRPDSRIVRTETRPRAGLGISRTDITPVPAPETPKPPSVEDLDSLSDKEIAETLNAIRRQRALNRRSN